MPNLNNITDLLQNTKRVIAHHDEISRAKGEHFNLFSVLKIESRENNTHSAFLAELLNPKGTHLKGSIFLQLFLEVVSAELVGKQEENKEEARRKIKNELLEKFLNSGTTRVATEFHIGNLNIEDKEGGRIDILIKNGKNILSIENKIHAPDQPAQVQRYFNFESENNTIFYLTLKGKKPHMDSRGHLKYGEDYFILSYRQHILKWLMLCLKEVPNLTSVREAINQYILLIKKLTHTLNTDEKKELHEVMVKHLEESEYIAQNYERMINTFHSRFRTAVKDELKKKLDPEIFSVENGGSVKHHFSQLWIKLRNHPNPQFKFGIASFSGKGHIDGNLFVGLLDEGLQELKNIPEQDRIKNEPWRHTYQIRTEKDNKINLRDKYTLRILSQPESAKYHQLLNNVVNKTLEFISDYEKKLPSAFFLPKATTEEALIP